ncbi:hypothetical protein ACIBG7_40885 [Nonomuraea sp. NPDC050328]|uniref:hypothetical protein n=1 Tax=Nonomuraea sp. NPDC050328 TaxID=3364361 RepID=UPI00379BD345
MTSLRRVPFDVASYVRHAQSRACLVGAHIAALPYEEQQYHALMTENGVLEEPPAGVGAAIRAAILTDSTPSGEDEAGMP